MKEYLIKEGNVLGNNKENIYKVFATEDKLNKHLLFMKKVSDKNTIKDKVFIITYNKKELKVTQIELEKELDINHVESFLAENQLLNKSITVKPIDVWTDCSYVYHLSKRYSLDNRHHEQLKEILVENSYPGFKPFVAKADDVLSEFILSIVFYKINKLKFVSNFKQLEQLTNHEKEALLTLNGLPEDVLYKLNDKMQKVGKNYVKRVDISPLYLFKNKLKLKELINQLAIIPYADETECHFFLTSDYLQNYMEVFDLSMDKLLVDSYKSTVLIEESLRYVAFVESLKRIQFELKKLDTLKIVSQAIYDKQIEFIKEKLEEKKGTGLITTFYISDLFLEIEKNVAKVQIHYPTHKLDNWLVNKENYLREDYYVMGIENHADFSFYVLNHLALHDKEFIFKAIDSDFVYFSNKRKTFILEIKTVKQNEFKLKAIYTKEKALSNIEKEMIQVFCNQNHIKFVEKEHRLLR